MYSTTALTLHPISLLLLLPHPPPQQLSPLLSLLRCSLTLLSILIYVLSTLVYTLLYILLYIIYISTCSRARYLLLAQ
jgi:hypothetical protein